MAAIADSLAFMLFCLGLYWLAKDSCRKIRRARRG